MGGDQLASANINPLLGVCQKLVASKVNDNYGFTLLNSIVDKVSFVSLWSSSRNHHLIGSKYLDHGMRFQSYLDASMPAMMTILFKRLQLSRTVKYAKGLIVFLCLYAVKRGAAALVQVNQ